MPRSLVENLMMAALLECCPPKISRYGRQEDWFNRVVENALADLLAFSEKDPAAGSEPERVVSGYSSFRAVAHYRLAHALTTDPEPHAAWGAMECATFGRLISCRGKLLSGAELHPACRIGRRLILDHGYGAVIGDDCYLLGGITLGSVGISDNPMGKRYPTIGDRVQIGAFARIFGPVTIGDDVFIGPHCVIKEDVPSGSIVTVKTEIQVTRIRNFDATSKTSSRNLPGKENVHDELR